MVAKVMIAEDNVRIFTNYQKVLASDELVS